MKELLGKLRPVFYLLVILSIIGLGFGEYYIYRELQNFSTETGMVTSVVTKQDDNVDTNEVVGNTPDSCGPECKNEIEKAVSSAISALPENTETKVVEKQVTVISKPSGTAYIPMGSSATTTSVDWMDVDDSAIYIDVVNDYAADATVSWEASLKVAHGNGKAFARLYDATNNIAVDKSELSTTDNAVFTQVTSKNLPFWRGRNLYKVQIKSLNSFEVTYSGGKIKVVY